MSLRVTIIVLHKSGVVYTSIGEEKKEFKFKLIFC